MLRVSRVQDLVELSNERFAWNQLAPNQVLSSAEWLWNWWHAYRGDAEVYVLTVRDASERMVAAAPLFLTRSLTSGNTLRFLGSGKVCTDYQTILALPEYRDQAVAAIVEWLCQSNDARRDQWDHLDLEATPQNDPAISLLAAMLERRGGRADVRPALGCWKLALPDTWDAFVKQTRSGIGRKLRKLDRDYVQTGRVTLTTSDEHADWHELLGNLSDFHQRRWAEVGVDGCFGCDKFSSFLDRALADLVQQQKAWISQLVLDGEPAAAAVFLCDSDTYSLYQCGMNPDLREHQPGWLMNILNIRTMIARHVKCCDYLRGDERYKKELGSTLTPQRSWRISAPGSVSRFRHSIWLTQDRLVGWGKQLAATRMADR
jgi:CelD/BcsL family acetyltransferase involved in cellulose biosynthesis